MKIDKRKLEIAMANACMSTAELQKNAMMPKQTLFSAISGKNIKPVTVGKIAKALGVAVTEILAD